MEPVVIENILDMGVDALAAVLMAVLGMVASAIGNATKSEKAEKVVNEVVAEGVSWAKKKAKKELKGTDYDFESRAAALAVKYINENAPRALKKAGYKPEMLQKKVESWL